MVLSLGEPPWRFLLLLFIHFCSSFCCSCSSFHFLACLPCHQHSTLVSQAREGLKQLWALPRLLLIAFAFSSTASATVLSGRFLPTGVFYLTLLHQHFDSTCVYQGLPGSRQFFLEVCRASYWSSKHRPGPSVCLIHSNPQKFYTGRFYFSFMAARTCEESAPREMRTLSTKGLACWKHFVLSVWLQSLMISN